MRGATAEFDTALAVSAAYDAAELALLARVTQDAAARAAARPSGDRDISVYEGLTRRQVDIVSRVVQGMTHLQIAEELFVSEKTIEAHLSRLFAKLDVSSRTALAARAAADSARRPDSQV